MCKDNDNAKGAGKFLDTDTWEALKKAGYSEEELQRDQPFGPVIFSYTRKQAIDDGVLVDVTEIARRVGFVIPVAMTATCWAAIGHIYSKPEEKVMAVEVFLRRLHGRVAYEIVSGHSTDRITYKHADADTWALVGPGDEGEPVLTVMLEGED